MRRFCWFMLHLRKEFYRGENLVGIKLAIFPNIIIHIITDGATLLLTLSL